MKKRKIEEVKAKILVVDDEESIRTIIARRLELDGYMCITAPNGKEAVKTATVETFDLVLTDVKMPGMSGIELLSQIVSDHPDTGVVMITAMSDAQTAVDAMKLGAYDYITKPFDLDALSIKVERALEKKQLLQENKDYRLLLSEQALRESKKRYSALVENLADAVFTSGKNIIWCNDQVKEIFGYSKDELIGRKASELLTDGGFSSPTLRDIETQLKEGNHFRGIGKAKRNDDVLIDIEFSISRIPDSNPPEYVTIVRDITERKQAEEDIHLLLLAQEEQNKVLIETQLELEKTLETVRKSKKELQESEKKLNRYLEHSPEAICVTTLKGIILYVNEATEQLTGFFRDELIGNDFIGLGLLSPEAVSKPAEWIKKNRHRKRQRPEEMELIRKDGNKIFVEVSTFTTSPKSDRHETEVIGIVRDITERKRAENALAELNRLKAEFVANVSHELRTPLQSIGGFAKLLLNNKVPDEDTQKEFLSIIDKQTERLTEMINDLLDVSRIESGRFSLHKEDISVEAVVRDAIKEISSIASDRGIKLRSRLGKSLPPVSADSQRIKQVMTNLIGNAIKFSEGNTEVLIKANAKGNEVWISVIDQGIGIPEEALPKLFERFYQVDGSMTRSTNGSGLGLYISGQIIEGHKGRIWAESKVGEGSTFTFTLPLNVQPEDIKPTHMKTRSNRKTQMDTEEV